MDVYFTVDTEVWLDDSGLAGFDAAYERDILGRTGGGDFGTAYQARELNRRGLKGVFFVEALYASAAGTDTLSETVQLLQNENQDVELHLHPEWLDIIPQDLVGNARGKLMRNFDEHQQTILLERAIGNLEQAGAKDICAFRAGNYGADFNTLKALARCGIKYDSSYNFCYLQSDCSMDLGRPLLQPTLIDGVVEIPINFFRDLPGHFRHTQLAAASFAELQRAMLQAWRSGWQTFVIVSHSFELINRAKQAPDSIVIKRFEMLCDFLEANKDKFTTRGFRSGVTPDKVAATDGLTGSSWNTLGRMLEQARRWGWPDLNHVRPHAGGQTDRAFRS